MNTTTATLRYTSSRALDTRDAMARVAAGPRVAAERVAREAREAAERAHAQSVALAYVAEIVQDGAERVGFKICDDWGKHRFVVPAGEAVAVLARNWGGDVEAWGIRADGSYTEVW